ncbi:MAG: methyltransferase domain-containing protein [Desulfobulbaceae bacterium]|jgi:ubiquinone/menaquinone biosynthesis C-methylase UbiE|nr:methyltransferase domain-containing protein [Desulfobulbaceae bacterium]
MFEETADIETASDAYAARFAAEVGAWFLERQAAITLELLKNFPQATVLDVGGGHGQLTAPLLAAGYRLTVTGSDDSCRARLASVIAAGKCAWHTCDSLALPFADRAFDVVISFRLLPHVTKWRPFLAEMCRVADHAVLFDYPDKRSANILYEALFAVKKKLEGNTRPFSLFSRRQITDEMTANGFSPPIFRPQFFWPMVLHRKIGKQGVAKASEAVAAACGLTRLFGSPMICRADRV